MKLFVGHFLWLITTAFLMMKKGQANPPPPYICALTGPLKWDSCLFGLWCSDVSTYNQIYLQTPFGTRTLVSHCQLKCASLLAVVISNQVNQAALWMQSQSESRIARLHHRPHSTDNQSGVSHGSLWLTCFQATVAIYRVYLNVIFNFVPPTLVVTPTSGDHTVPPTKTNKSIRDLCFTGIFNNISNLYNGFEKCHLDRPLFIFRQETFLSIWRGWANRSPMVLGSDHKNKVLCYWTARKCSI